MPIKKLQIGIIGLGRWGANILKNVLKMPDINLASVATSKTKVIEKIPKNTKIFRDWKELIDTIRDISPENVLVTHGREEALLSFLKKNGYNCGSLNLLGFEDEDD